MTGKIPTDINGVYIRNGPNPLQQPDNNQAHFFDGDSMIHAFRIQGGKLYYCNRWLRTPKFENEKKIGKSLYLRIGELFNLIGLFKASLI